MTIETIPRVPCALSVMIFLILSSHTLPAITADKVSGVNIVEFSVPEGGVKVFLPDDMAAGDTLSAHIGLYPSGITPDVKDKYLRLLNGFFVETSYNNFPLESGTLTLKIPRNPERNMIKFALRAGNNKLRSTSYVQIRHSRQPADTAGIPTPYDYPCPLVGQAGRYIEIKGPFDGDFNMTDFRIGSMGPLVLAESPRKLAFEAPVTIVGSVELVLKEQDIIVKRPFTCLQVVKIREDEPVRVSPNSGGGYDIDDPNEDAGIGEKNYPATSQTLKFSSIKAEETIGTAEKIEEVRKASESSLPANRIGEILASQMSSPFSGTEYVSEQEYISETLIEAGNKESGLPTPREKKWKS